MQRIGVYSGTFDPVHTGHVAFALQAVSAAKLDSVYFMPERMPRYKPHVTHYAHRVAMIRRATRPYSRLRMLETPEKQFSVQKTLPRLRQDFPDAQLIFLCGSDVVLQMGDWKGIDRLLANVELCVGLRQQDSTSDVRQALSGLNQSLVVTMFESPESAVSSSSVRLAIRNRQGVKGLLSSVRSYAAQEWLYL